MVQAIHVRGRNAQGLQAKTQRDDIKPCKHDLNEGPTDFKHDKIKPTSSWNQANTCNN